MTNITSEEVIDTQALINEVNGSGDLKITHLSQSYAEYFNIASKYLRTEGMKSNLEFGGIVQFYNEGKVKRIDFKKNELIILDKDSKKEMSIALDRVWMVNNQEFSLRALAKQCKALSASVFNPATGSPVFPEDVSAPRVIEANECVVAEGADYPGSPAEYRLNPLNALEGVTVVVEPYLDMLVGDSVTLTWRGNTGLGVSDLTRQVTVAGPISFEIPVSAVGYNIGTHVMVDYKIVRAGIESVYSPKTLINIDWLENLPAPIVAQVADGELMDNGDVAVTIANWPLMSVGQRVWLSLEGEDVNGSGVVIKPWVSLSLTAADIEKGLSKAIGSTELKKFKIDSFLTVIFKVDYSGQDSEDAAEVFPTLRFKLKLSTAVIH